MLKILMVLTGEGDETVWLPILVEHEPLPTPVPVIVDTRYIGGLTEEEWIEQYKSRAPGAAKNNKQFVFHPFDRFAAITLNNLPLLRTVTKGLEP